jgi:hypothetical protein
MWAWLLVIDDAQLDERVEVGPDDGFLPPAAVIEPLTARSWHLMD